MSVSGAIAGTRAATGVGSRATAGVGLSDHVQGGMLQRRFCLYCIKRINVIVHNDMFLESFFS